jgi:hypothetical protein
MTTIWQNGVRVSPDPTPADPSPGWRRALDSLLVPYEFESGRLDRAYSQGLLTDAEYDRARVDTNRRFRQAVAALVGDGAA